MTNTKRSALFINAGNNISAYKRLEIPYQLSASNSAGPRLVLMAGSHGDEYEGQIALKILANHLASGDLKLIKGSVLIVPHANPPACKGASRLSPLDTGNLSNSFASPTNITTSIAGALEQKIFRGSNIIIDIHSGGHSLEYTPVVISYVPAQSGRKNDNIKTNMECFDVSFAMRKKPWNGTSSVFNAAERQNCQYLAAEFGGAATLNTNLINSVLSSLYNIMGLYGVIEHTPSEQKPKIWLQGNGSDNRIYAKSTGVFCQEASLGQKVNQGQLAGKLYSHSDYIATPVDFSTAGWLIARRPLAHCEEGDCLIELGRPLQI